MKIILAGAGSIAQKHLAAIKDIPYVDIVSLVSGDAAEAKEVADANNIPHWTLDLSEALAIESVEAVILATPTPLHAQQAIQVMDAGKHVLIEIPMGMSLAESRIISNKQLETGLTAMVCHTRRFNPPHQWIHQQLRSGKLHLHHLVVETLFHRRENKNALGKPRDWADHLLWHHACHSVDLFAWQTQKPIVKRWAQQGPVSKVTGVPLDMTIGMQAVGGSLCTVALSFNNEGPLGSWFRYICEEGTFKVRYNDMTDGWDKPYEYDWKGVSKNGIELQNREFFDSIKEKREPNASVAQCLDIMEILHKMEFLANN
jgi:2-hydroxy-4-carboxymuconate semialdehyde hemiacetal dehydrogenase